MGGSRRTFTGVLGAGVVLMACNSVLDIEEGTLGQAGNASGAAGNASGAAGNASGAAGNAAHTGGSDDTASGGAAALRTGGRDGSGGEPTAAAGQAGHPDTGAGDAGSSGHVQAGSGGIAGGSSEQAGGGGDIGPTAGAGETAGTGGGHHTGGIGGTAPDTDTGGVGGIAGNSETGGSSETGGATASGGESTIETGGTAGSGGTCDTGGAAGSGGTCDTGGTDGSGATIEIGGTTGSGGTGGVSGSGGSSATCEGVDFATDTRNCGWCEHDCGTGTCTDGMCTATLVDTDSLNNGGDVVLLDSFVVWSGYDMRWRSRTDPTVNLREDDLGIYVQNWLAVWGDTIYVGGASLSEGVMAWRSTSGDGSLTITDRTPRGGFAVDDTGVYWGTCVSSVGTIVFAAHEEPEVEYTVASDVPCSQVMQLDGDDLWFTSPDDPGLYRLNKNDRDLVAPAAHRAVASRGSRALLVDGDYVYVGSWDQTAIDDDFPSDRIVRMRRDGTGGIDTIMLPGTQWRPMRFVVDGDYLYWTNFGRVDNSNNREHGSVNRVCLSCPTREAQPVAVESGLATGLAVDEDWVYWVACPESDTGQLKRTPK